MTEFNMWQSVIRHKKAVILGLILIAGSGLFIARPLLLHEIGAYPIVGNELHPVDLLVVVSGTLPEIHYGLDLFHEGYAKKMLFLGHFPVELAVISEDPFEVVEKPWDEVARHMAIRAGVPADSLIFSDAFTTSTYERVAQMVQAAKQHDQHSMIIISDPIHSRRIAFSARKILRNDDLAFLMAPTPQNYYLEAYRFDPYTWWLDENHPKTLFDEYTKLIYYWLKYTF